MSRQFKDELYENNEQSPIIRVVSSILSQKPDVLFSELEEAERVRNRSLPGLVTALDDALANATKASRLAMITTVAARMYREGTMPEIEASLRDRARKEMPLKLNKDGTEKNHTIQEIQDYIAANYSKEVKENARNRIYLEAAAEHATNLARIWSYRSRDIQEMASCVRSIGDGGTMSQNG